MTTPPTSSTPHPTPDLATRPPSHTGFLAWFAQNRVAANLLMIMILVGGIISMATMRKEVFPTLDTGLITIRVPYLGGSPEEVEDGVILRVEEAIAGIEGIKRIRSFASEGAGTVVAELEDYADRPTALRDIEAAIDRIDTFPNETERPIIAEASNQIQVLNLALYGDVSERTLKELGEQVRDDLTGMENISQVVVTGVRRYELSIEVSEQALRRYGISFQQVADAVTRSSLDLPGGSVKTLGGEILIRTEGQKYVGREFEDIVVLANNDGTLLHLSDIATVRDGFEDSDVLTRFNGSPAAYVLISRVGDQDAVEIADTVKAYAEQLKHRLPAGVHADIFADSSVFLQARISLLTRNAYIGLFLVFLSLMLFLDLRLAFWTTMGIPISFMGAFWVLPQFDMTINMISLFAFIIVLGIVVDDAIVVGENIFAYREKGMRPVDAAIKGVKEMAAPVTLAITTTIAAFSPLLFTAGEIGKILRFMPVVVIAVLLLSLVEALLILPAHLSGKHRNAAKPGPLTKLQELIRKNLDRFIHGPYKKTLGIAVRWRYATLAIAFSTMLLMFAYIIGGHIKFVFFEAVDADNVVAALEMPQGTPVEQTQAVIKRIEQAAQRVREKIDSQRTEDQGTIFKNISTTIGLQPFKEAQRGPGASNAVQNTSSSLAEVNVELVGGESRDVASGDVERLWKEELGEVAGVSSLTFQSTFFNAGEAINVELSHRDFDRLLLASDELKQLLRGYVGVSDINDSFLPGKREMKLSLTPAGRALGLTLADLATQTRQGFYGEEAQRIQRKRDDIRVMVRYPEEQRRSLADIQSMRIRLPDGTEVPFATVASVEMGRGYAEIQRADRRRIIAVTADVDDTLPGVSANVINGQLRDQVLPELARHYPGLTFRFEGEQAEQTASLDSLMYNFVIALLGIYALLGIQFRDYVQPMIVMSAIPFGLIGAVIGHIALGMDLSFLSGFGIVALTGVVVNDSLIMIDLINRERAEGVPVRQVIMDCGIRRFRPILLTTLTTFCGLTPMLLERSLQARFLVPVAVSLAFGVAFATAITLLLVPTLYMILEDVKALTARIFSSSDPADTTSPTPSTTA